MTTDKIYANFYTWKPVVSHKALHLIFEVPLEQQEKVLKVLGAPMPDSTKWVEIRLLDASVLREEAAKEELREQLIASEIADRNVVPLKNPARAERFRNASSADQAKGLAHMWADDPEFQRWCGRDGTAEALRYIHITCHVESCKEFSRNEEALKRFDSLIAVPYQQELGRMAEVRR